MKNMAFHFAWLHNTYMLPDQSTLVTLEIPFLHDIYAMKILIVQSVNIFTTFDSTGTVFCLNASLPVVRPNSTRSMA